LRRDPSSFIQTPKRKHVPPPQKQQKGHVSDTQTPIRMPQDSSAWIYAQKRAAAKYYFFQSLQLAT
jgi:hypothetical protein